MQVSEYKVSSFGSRVKQTVKQNADGQVEKVDHHALGTAVFPWIGTNYSYDAHQRPTGYARMLKDGYGADVSQIASHTLSYHSYGTETTPYVQTETLSAGDFTQAFTYSYDAKGNITNNGASAFSYDKFGRLTAETTLSGATTAVTYDTCGNVLTKTGYANGFTYDSLSRLTNYNGTAISYDYAGNPLNWVGVTNMAYARRNLLASANANGTAVSYAYDGEGRRISKTVNGVTQTFYYEGDRLAAWKNGSDTYYFLYDVFGKRHGGNLSCTL